MRALELRGHLSINRLVYIASTTRADSPRHSAAFPSGSANDAADAALAALQFSRQLFDDLIQRRLEGLARGL